MERAAVSGMSRLRPGAVFLCVVVGAWLGCGSGRGDQQAADSLTRRERDSIIGASKLPGATGVGAALRAADSAAARRRVEDSLARVP